MVFTLIGKGWGWKWLFLLWRQFWMVPYRLRKWFVRQKFLEGWECCSRKRTVHNFGCILDDQKIPWPFCIPENGVEKNHKHFRKTLQEICFHHLYTISDWCRFFKWRYDLTFYFPVSLFSKVLLPLSLSKYYTHWFKTGSISQLRCLLDVWYKSIYPSERKDTYSTGLEEISSNRHTQRLNLSVTEKSKLTQNYFPMM